MSVGRLGLVILISAVSLQVTGAEQGVGQVTQRQLTAEEQARSRNDPGAASGEQERIQTTEQQQERVVEQAQPVDASKHRSKHGNQTGSSGHSSTKGHNARPSGSKNKPQKSGR